MAKPSFRTLWANYPRGTPADVLRSIGWDEFIDKPGYENTCAIRMSICLAASGSPVKSSQGMAALSGDIKGKPIELRQDKLSEYLLSLWPRPLKMHAGSAEDTINGRDGIISFWKIGTYNVGGVLGGHIDLIDGSVVERKNWLGYVTSRKAQYDYGTHGYMALSESVWFWEMPK